MIQEIGVTKSPSETPVPEATWIQVTFTLDNGSYRALRIRAEEEGLTVPGFVRESMIDFLKDTGIASSPKRPFEPQSAEYLP